MALTMVDYKRDSPLSGGTMQNFGGSDVTVSSEFRSGNSYAPVASELSSAPSTVNYGFNQNSVDAILNDQTGKYIGSKPVKVQLETPSAISAAEAAGSAAAPAVKTNTANTIQSALGQAGNKVLEVAGAKANLAYNEQQNDLRYWLEQGKYWFDKERDLKPDIEQFMSEMPSATESLSKGTLTGGKASNAVQGILEPTGLAIESAVTAGGKNKEWKGAGEYASNQALTGAIQGYQSGGWVGAIVGAALNAVMGVFSWSSAIDTDKKNRAKYQAEFDKQLREWTVARNKRLIEEQRLSVEKKNAAIEEAKVAKEKKAEEKTVQKVASREAMKNVILNAGSFRRSRSAQRAKRWGYRNAA